MALLLATAVGGHAAARPTAAGPSAEPLQSARLLNDGEVRELSLDGEWQAGIDRHYDRVLHVPGLASDPSQPSAGTLWYKRTVDLPAGSWIQATLTLKGARFAPRVFVNGEQVSSAEGGMAATIHRFPLPAGNSFTLEIALASLSSLDKQDASAVPGADRWRNNVSSYLWDSVVLRLHAGGEILRVTPFADFQADAVSLHWDLGAVPGPQSTVQCKLLDEKGKVIVASGPQAASGLNGSTILALHHVIERWSPEHPHLYRLRTELFSGGHLLDAREQSFGLRDFTTAGVGLRLNGEPYHIRMGTVVWHRWTRDPRARLAAFDPIWFENNIVLRLKRSGANALRFHLGLPPEELLDLCDRDGLAVQMEWPFFHGVAASQASLEVQWRAWLDTAMRHPSVVIVHPWNETGEDQLKVAHRALNGLLPLYPPLVVAHRDITPVHKYWWSLFENVGLYYDSAAQFGSPVMADEFGGNYIDEKGDPGPYPAAREAFLRFLGRDNTREERLQLQADADARIAEYWRRLGVAGFSPFCILGSPQDGNDWFLGPIDVPAPTPKPVWAALSAAFAQQSLSLELWNRNFAPGETLRMPLWFFNDGDRPQKMVASIHVLDANTSADAMPAVRYRATLQAHTSQTLPIDIPLPQHAGEWRMEARLESPSTQPGNPVVSSWRVRTFVPQPSARLLSAAIAVPHEETELRAMLAGLHVHIVEPSDESAAVQVGSRAAWQKLRKEAGTHRELEASLHHGRSLVLLDAGPQPLGVGYSAGSKLGGPLEGAPSVGNPAKLEETTLFGGIKLAFLEVAEPESTIQEAENNQQLWQGVPRGATWLWNGLRGGLIVPAADMQVTGLGGKALLAIWQPRGADPERIASGKYYAYELAGYYAYGDRGDDAAVSGALRKRVKLLVDDAPALRNVINPDAPMTITDLGTLYRQNNAGGQAESVTPMANAGKNLSRAPVVEFAFGKGEGKLIVSQLLTAGRLLPGEYAPGPGVYGLRYDPIAVQFVLNMLDSAMAEK